MKRIVILTADELRHDYFKMKFALEKDIHVLKTYCDITRKKYNNNIDYTNINNVHHAFVVDNEPLDVIKNRYSLTRMDCNRFVK